MEFLFGLLDLALLGIGSRRQAFWALVVLIAICLAAVAANMMEPRSP